MAGKRHGLSDRAVKAKKKPGRYPDGGSLYFHITERGNRSWEYNFRIHRKRRAMGLGPYPTVSLKEARELRDDARKLVRAGTDPIIARGAKRQVAAAALSVRAACESYITAQRAKWKTERHVDQINQRLRDYVYPIVGHLLIADVNLAEVKQVLMPIWQTKNPTAGRTRQYMEDVTNWAIAEGIRNDESNPWEIRRLRFALPFGIHKVVSHPSLSFEQAPSFLIELRAQRGVKARAMELTMLCATRIGDVTGGGKQHSEAMKWSHVDLPGAVWRIPDTKMSRPFDVPLSEPALRLLAEMKRFRDPTTDFVFPGAVTGTALNAATLRHMLKAMGYTGIVTTHGMRACFRTWASESTAYDTAVIEASLAHQKNRLDQAYHRGDFFNKRRRLMSLWADHLEGRTIMHGDEMIKSAA